MPDWQKEREDKLADLTIGANLLAYLLTVSAFVICLPRSYSFNDFYLVLLGIFLPATAIIAVDYYLFYHASGSSPKRMFIWNITKQGALFLIITYTLIVSQRPLQPLGALYLLPVILGSITFGRGGGILFALISSIILFALVDFESRQGQIDCLASTFLFSGTFLLAAWFLGGVNEVEKKTTQHLATLADSDDLTGLGNFRFFQDKLSSFFKNPDYNNKGQCLSLVLLDIDHFKMFNDTFGHRLGDKVLVGLSLLLKENAPPGSVLSRYESDKFAIILPGYNQQKAVQFAHLLRQKVAATNFLPELAWPYGNITVSMGVATFPYHVKNQHDLWDAAENALISSKFTGKNNVQVYLGILEKISQGAEEGDREIISSLKTLMTLVNAKDRYTYGHSERVTHYVKNFARHLGLPEDEIRLLEYGSFLHDIGKLEVPGEILNKNGPLSKSELDIMRNHPHVGAAILRPVSFLQPIIPVVLCHHENLDGTGYPAGLCGQDIPLHARILRIVDSFDAMRTIRPYRKPLTLQQALGELERYSGSHYDPELVRCFTEMISKSSDME